MLFAITAAALSATAVYSQSTPSAMSIATSGLQQLSSECRSEVLSLAASPLVGCLGLAELAPAISANASLVPILDDWMTSICTNEACDQELLESTAQNFTQACASDLESYNVNAQDVEGLFGLYPLVRELVCLKTTEPFEANSTSSANSTVSNTTASTNSSESEFCVTSLLTELSDYLGSNITVNSVFALALGQDQESLQALTEIPPSALCQDCIYAAAGLIEQQYPGLWAQNITGNFSVGGFLNETCVNETFPEIDRDNNTITLPNATFPSAENSTYAYGIIYFNGTYLPDQDVIEQPPALPFLNFTAAPINGTSNSTTETATSASVTATSTPVAASASASSAVASVTAATSAAAAKRDVTAAKRRWVGQQ